MQSKLAAVVTGIVVCLATASVSSHHSFTAEFDANKPLVLEGTVTKTEWINPHSWVHMNVTRPNGKVEAWMIELGTVGTLVRKGFTKQVLPVGSKVKVSGFQSRDGTFKANGRDITLSDGRSFFVGSSGAGAPPETKK